MTRWKITGKFLTAISMIAFLLFQSIPITAQENNNSQSNINQELKLGTVQLESNISVDVNNLVMIPSENGQLVTFVLSIHNNSNHDLNFIDYWVELASKSGAKYSIKSTEQSLNKIAAKTEKDVYFYSQVGGDLTTNDLIIKIVKWNGSSYSNVIGQVQAPVRYNQVTQTNSARVIAVENSKLSMLVQQANIGKSEKYYRPDVKILVKNEGKRSVTMPEFELSILTEDGLQYPLAAKGLSGTAIAPLAEKEIQLTGNIPVQAGENAWKLVLLLPSNEGKDKIPLAIFNLPRRTVDQANDLGKFYTFSTMDGIYNVRLDSINRLPIEDEDLIVSNLTILNKDTKALPVPKLTAKYNFNETIERTATVSNNDKLISIAPGQTIYIQAVAKVPYTLDISKMNVIIQQEDTTSGETETLELVEFTSSGNFSPVSTISSGDSYMIEDIGYRAEVKVDKVMTFSGSNANVIAAQLNVKNLEKRLTNIQRFAGYFENGDGTIYQATIQSISTKLSPGSTAVLYATAFTPKTVDINEMKLIVGKAVEEVPASGDGENAIVGYVNPNSFEFPAEFEAQTNMKDIDIYPYKLTINKIATQIRYGDSQVILDLDYTLEQDLLATSSLKDQKVVVEINDNSNKAVFKRELNIASLGETATSGSLEVGKHSLRETWTDEDMIMDIQTLKDFSLNIYLQIQPGYNKLIATEKFPWFVSRVIND